MRSGFTLSSSPAAPTSQVSSIGWQQTWQSSTYVNEPPVRSTCVSYRSQQYGHSSDTNSVPTCVRARAVGFKYRLESVQLVDDVRVELADPARDGFERGFRASFHGTNVPWIVRPTASGTRVFSDCGTVFHDSARNPSGSRSRIVVRCYGAITGAFVCIAFVSPAPNAQNARRRCKALQECAWNANPGTQSSSAADRLASAPPWCWVAAVAACCSATRAIHAMNARVEMHAFPTRDGVPPQRIPRARARRNSSVIPACMCGAANRECRSRSAGHDFPGHA